MTAPDMIWVNELTWCSEQVHDDDVPYIRADIYDALQARHASLLRELRDLLDAAENHIYGTDCAEELAADIRSIFSGTPSGAADLPRRVLDMCKHRGWSLDWTHRGAYLHLESSELIEAIRGKRGDPKAEAADVLLVLMSITENAGISWPDVLAQAAETVDRMMVRPRYPGEEHDGCILARADTAPPTLGEELIPRRGV